MTPPHHRTPSSCAAALAFLQRQLDGDTSDLPLDIEAHLDDCAECRERFYLAPELLATLLQIDAPRPTAVFAERLIVTVQRDARLRRRRQWQVAGAVAAAVLVAVWLNQPRSDTPGTAPDVPEIVQASPPALRQSVVEAGDAAVALAHRTAREAVGEADIALPDVPAMAQPWQALEIAAAPLADARQGLSEGFEPMVSSARRAMRLFMREVSSEATDQPQRAP